MIVHAEEILPISRDAVAAGEFGGPANLCSDLRLQGRDELLEGVVGLADGLECFSTPFVGFVGLPAQLR